MKANIIHILGASGSGTSTLGQALEREYGYKWLDTDDYFWLPTNPLFTTQRPHEERIPLMETSIENNPKCVISGSLCGWGDVFIPKFDLVIYIYTPADIRKERLEKREYKRFGERIQEGGDMYDEHIKFMDWAMAYDTGDIHMRSAKRHDDWLRQIACPVINLNGTDACEYNLNQIAEYLI
ncbi:MAG: AAA family ATPase [Oscillospiraceae bacterium]|nr:AAA family ATPase [Oscillospiraceae bacterium]